MQAVLFDGCNVIGRFDAPTTRPIRNAFVPPVATTAMRLGASSGRSTPFWTASVYGNAVRCGFANLSATVTEAPAASAWFARDGARYDRPSGVCPALFASATVDGNPPTVRTIGAGIDDAELL